MCDDKRPAEIPYGELELRILAASMFGDPPTGESPTGRTIRLNPRPIYHLPLPEDEERRARGIRRAAADPVT